MTSKILIRTAYDGLAKEMSDKTATYVDPDDPSLTKQEFTDECDINLIIARFAQTGEFLHQNSLAPRFGDFTLVPDFQSALNLISDAEASFASLSSKIRDRFANDPANFLEFVSDPANADEMRELGILNPLPASAGDTAPEAAAQAAPAAPATSTPTSQ